MADDQNDVIECPVCFTPLDETPEGGNPMDYTPMKWPNCIHQGHKFCMNTWAFHQISQKIHPNCMTCRASTIEGINLAEDHPALIQIKTLKYFEENHIEEPILRRAIRRYQRHLESVKRLMVHSAVMQKLFSISHKEFYENTKNRLHLELEQIEPPVFSSNDHTIPPVTRFNKDLYYEMTEMIEQYIVDQQHADKRDELMQCFINIETAMVDDWIANNSVGERLPWYIKALAYKEIFDLAEQLNTQLHLKKWFQLSGIRETLTLQTFRYTKRPSRKELLSVIIELLEELSQSPRDQYTSTFIKCLGIFREEEDQQF